MLRTLLVPLDGSTLAERALPVAFDLARRTGGEVHLVRAHAPLAIIGATAEGVVTQDMLAADDALRARAKEYVAQQATQGAAEWGVRAVPHVDDGSASGLITDVADRVLADLIVMTTHGAGGFAPGWLGSVADAVIRHSHRPVLALPEQDAPGAATFTPRSILVTYDGSEGSAAILGPARDLALATGARLTVLRVVTPYVPMDAFSALTGERPDAFGLDGGAQAAKAELDQMVATLSAGGVKASAMVVEHASVTRTLLVQVKEQDPDCIAVATQGRGISRLFVGSVADKLIRAAGKPVLVLRPLKT
jgi:nucleotide-binding universal stress UspA family protein